MCQGRTKLAYRSARIQCSANSDLRSITIANQRWVSFDCSITIVRCSREGLSSGVRIIIGKFELTPSNDAVLFFLNQVMKQSFLTILRERFHPLQYDFTTAHEHAWMKFLSFLIQYITHEDQSIREPTQVVIATISMNNQWHSPVTCLPRVK